MPVTCDRLIAPAYDYVPAFQTALLRLRLVVAGANLVTQDAHASFQSAAAQLLTQANTAGGRGMATVGGDPQQVTWVAVLGRHITVGQLASCHPNAGHIADPAIVSCGFAHPSCFCLKGLAPACRHPADAAAGGNRRLWRAAVWRRRPRIRLRS
jgi:hypothetical protein